MTRSTLLLDIPVPILTPRLELRDARPGDGVALNAAVLESFDALTKTMPWARSRPLLDESEDYVRRAAAAWLLRTELAVLGFDRVTGELAVSTGLHRIDWSIPSFEIGYWVRASFAGQGLVTEAANALTRYAFAALSARRVEIRCDSRNTASIAVIHRLGYEREGLLRRDSLGPDGEPRDTLVYARLDPDGLPELAVTW